jgi:phage terminase large subunit
VTLSLLLSVLLTAAPVHRGLAPAMRSAPAPSAQTATGSNPPWDPAEEEALAALTGWIRDPVLFVRQVFGAIPDEWQADALRAIPANPRVGMSACKGPGKSCVLAWTIWWFIYTREDAQVMCTSITGDNLKDNLWKELSVWYSKSPMLQRAFEVRGERIIHRERPKTWWVSARTWAQNADPTQQANTLAGFHGAHVMVVLDEMGDYPDGVVVAA